MAFGGGLIGHNASLNYDIRYHQNNFCHPKTYFAFTVGFMISCSLKDESEDLKMENFALVLGAYIKKG